MKLGVGMLCFNNLDLSQMAFESIRNQDVPVNVAMIDNASTDGTRRWLEEIEPRAGWLDVHFSDHNMGITKGWNHLLDTIFSGMQCDFALIVNNDVVLPRWFARELMEYDKPLITGIDTEDIRDITYPVEPHLPLVPYPDFSAYMIRRDTWSTVGRFDERMFNYCSDCDYHVRAHRAGLDFWKATVRYFHQRSSTIVRANPEAQRWMHARADQDREVFKSLYGCLPGTKEYLALLDLV